MRRTLIALSLALSCAFAGGTHAQSFSTLEERMSAADFRRAGLDKLSAEELAALNEWLRKDAETRTTAAAPASTDTLGFRQSAPRNSGPIQSRLLGESTGWTYGTLFRLENGQIWRSLDRDNLLSGIRVSNPKVEIRQGVMGNWRLKFEGYNTSTNVERVE